MIYKRGCNKNGPAKSCNKCGIKGACGMYWYRFMWHGKLIRESTKQGNQKIARQMEAAHRTALAKGEVGIREKKPAPVLKDFLKKDFLPYIDAHFSPTKPKTAAYYSYGVDLLLHGELGKLKLDEITSQHAASFIAKTSRLSPAAINCGLRTLRRALNLATDWARLEAAPKISLAKGERQRERIINPAELAAYLELCPQPWRDAVVVLYGTAMRPGEVYKLRWEHILLNANGGLIQIVEGKSRAARRLLPMTAEVFEALAIRWETARKPTQGWVFPAASVSGHLEQGSAKNYHSKAVNRLVAACAAYQAWAKSAAGTDWREPVTRAVGLDKEFIARHAKIITEGFLPFQPYCLRHTALTRLAEAGCDPFTLARIAGHSTITITQRYCHPQAEAVERAFEKLGGGHNYRHTDRLPSQSETISAAVSETA